MPPLHQVSAFKRLLAEIDDGLPAEAAAGRLADLRATPLLYRRFWRAVGPVLFAVGFGVSVQATWQEVLASAMRELADGRVTAGAARLTYGLAMLLVLGLVLCTAAVVTLASAAAGEQVGTFVAAFAMTVVALRLGRRPGLPPPYVLYLGAFYVHLTVLFGQSAYRWVSRNWPGVVPV